MIHLTHTGFYAGALLCEKPRDIKNGHAHAAYAPLENPKYRTQCCIDCLKVWAIDAYDDTDSMPVWVKSLRREVQS